MQVGPCKLAIASLILAEDSDLMWSRKKPQCHLYVIGSVYVEIVVVTNFKYQIPEVRDLAVSLSKVLTGNFFAPVNDARPRTRTTFTSAEAEADLRDLHHKAVGKEGWQIYCGRIESASSHFIRTGQGGSSQAGK